LRSTLVENYRWVKLDVSFVVICRLRGKTHCCSFILNRL
jgi:hypothetical protein